MKTELDLKLRMYITLNLTPETMKLLKSTEKKITKDKNCENVPHLEITEVVLVHCSVVRVLYTFVLIGHLVNY